MLLVSCKQSKEDTPLILKVKWTSTKVKDDPVPISLRRGTALFFTPRASIHTCQDQLPHIQAITSSMATCCRCHFFLELFIKLIVLELFTCLQTVLGVIRPHMVWNDREIRRSTVISHSGENTHDHKKPDTYSSLRLAIAPYRVWRCVTNTLRSTGERNRNHGGLDRNRLY